MEGKNKMSKTLNNYIGILEEEAAIWEKLRTAVTDVARVRRPTRATRTSATSTPCTGPFRRRAPRPRLAAACRSASAGCIDCKRVLFKNMMAELTPIREKALSLKDDTSYILEALHDGAAACRRIAAETMDEVRDALGLMKG